MTATRSIKSKGGARSDVRTRASIPSSGTTTKQNKKKSTSHSKTAKKVASNPPKRTNRHTQRERPAIQKSLSDASLSVVDRPSGRQTHQCLRCLGSIHVIPDKPQQHSICCPRCNQWFHTRCYRQEIGLLPNVRKAEVQHLLQLQQMPHAAPPSQTRKKASASDSAEASFDRGAVCVACLSGVVSQTEVDAMHQCWINKATTTRRRADPELQAQRYAAELLDQGFTIVPLTAVGTPLLSDMMRRSVPQDDDDDKKIGGGNQDRSVADVFGQLKEFILDLHKDLMRSYQYRHDSGQPVPSLQSGYKNFRMRGEGRFEIVEGEIRRQMLPIVEQSVVPKVLALAFSSSPSSTSSSDGDWGPISHGCFLSLTGAEGQNLHTDGPSLLLPRASASDAASAPSSTSRQESAGNASSRRTDDTPHTLSAGTWLRPYAVNCFVPLIPMNHGNGTEFYPGTHKENLVPDETITPGAGVPANSQQKLGEHERRKENQPKKPLRIAPEVPVGCALLFDYRVLHRGLPNRRSEDRPCAYVTFARSWYRDTYNFNEARYPTALEVIPHLKRRRPSAEEEK